ncbi:MULTISPECIES: ImmA/IrrE family metallo-endopeptidase [Xanthomonas]|uniref:ImmA/IrrE family metallo-endopeptidase n=1 Tax=Xanthomonas TaxID=338 RepID=UPI0009B988E3|nr:MULTISPECIES: ImmA/IrrE family metallo-endopeptidase [Xanthomonas]QTK47137.1 ImmA/IrrE family metallo-endopeptidase [Xanthomonas euvesicatoria pv. alfalfae]
MLERQWAEHLIEQYWAPRPTPVDPEAIAKAMGIKIEAASPFSDNFEANVSGMYSNEGSRPCISYNILDPENRRRFTIAHELGHHVLQHGMRFRDTSSAFSSGSYDPVEVSANRFAAELLMPVYSVKVLVVDHGVTSIPQLAEAFKVSEQAMYYRLKNLGYVS